MKAPWTNKTGAAKIAAWSATVLGVSMGLCGANFFAVSGFMDANSSVAVSIFDKVRAPLTIAAYLELAGMLVGAMGLLVAFVVWLLEVVRKERNPE